MNPTIVGSTPGAMVGTDLAPVPEVPSYSFGPQSGIGSAPIVAGFTPWGLSKRATACLLAWLAITLWALIGAALWGNVWAQDALGSLWSAVGWKLGMLPPGGGV